MDNKITTEWHSAPKLCYFCDEKGHIKKECPQYLQAVELRLQYKEFTANKKQSRNLSFERKKKNPEPQEQEVLTEDLNMNMNQTEDTSLTNSEEMLLTNSGKTLLTASEEVEKEVIEISATMEEDLETSYNETFSDIDKENLSFDNASKTTVIETEKPEALNSPLVLIANDINLQSRINNTEEEFTVVSYKRKKDKKTSTKQKAEPIRKAPYRNHRNGVQNSQI